MRAGSSRRRPAFSQTRKLDDEHHRLDGCARMSASISATSAVIVSLRRCILMATPCGSLHISVGQEDRIELARA
jgi:hypothetical protein